MCTSRIHFQAIYFIDSEEQRWQTIGLGEYHKLFNKDFLSAKSNQIYLNSTLDVLEKKIPAGGGMIGLSVFHVSNICSI